MTSRNGKKTIVFQCENYIMNAEKGKEFAQTAIDHLLRVLDQIYFVCARRLYEEILLWPTQK